MTGNNWTQRVQGTTTSPALKEIRAAAQDMAQQANRAPGNTAIVFQTVANVVIIATGLATGALAFHHLWKELCRSKAHSNQSPGSGQGPPRRPHATTVASPASDDGRRHGRA